MSGGFFEYQDYLLEDFRRKIEELIETNGIPDEYGYIRDFSQETIDSFNHACALLEVARIYLHRIDWLASDDDGEDNYHDRLKNDLEEKLDEATRD